MNFTTTILLFKTLTKHGFFSPFVDPFNLTLCTRLTCRRSITFTNANSNSAAKTKHRHAPIQTSIAFTYETLGSDAVPADLCVVMVRTVNMPREILAGTASIVNQNETQDRSTIKTLGM